MTDETLFAAALEKPDATARAAYLDSACSDPDTRKRIDAFLAALDPAGAFLARAGGGSGQSRLRADA